MKYVLPSHWTDLPNQQGLLFFSQILNETLFDYSLDTYKSPALNTRVLCIEAIQTLDNIKLGLIKKQNISSIIEELLWSLDNDLIVKGIVGKKNQYIISNINKCKDDDSKLKEIILLLYHYLEDKNYLNNIKELLITLIPANKDKEKIYTITRAFVTELINYGYTSNFIYHTTNSFFYDKSSPFSHITPQVFFDIFNFEKKKFDIVYKVSKHFQEFGNLGSELGFKIIQKVDPSNLGNIERDWVSSIKPTETFAVFEGMEAFDVDGARINSERNLRVIGNLFSFYHHKEIPSINPFALVTNLSNSDRKLRGKVVKAIIKKSDIKPQIAAAKVKKLLNELSLSPVNLKRIKKAIDLHSIALSSEEIENKLLNLWTAIETLIPKKIDCGDDRIIQLIEAIAPFQVLNYINKLILQAADDFWYFNKKEAQQVLESVVLSGPKDNLTRMAALVMTTENEALRVKVYGILGNNPLLRFRLFQLNKNLSSGKKISDLLKKHTKKIQWQIRRIYRVRNLIVHSGKMPSYANLLVENLHNYFDDLLNHIIDESISKKRFKAINEVILNCEIDLKIKTKEAEQIGDKAITLDNFESIL